MVLQKRIAKEEIQMQISLLLMQQIAQLFLVLLMGYAVVKTGLLKASDSKVLSVVFVYLVMPCVVLNAFQIKDTPEIRTRPVSYTHLDVYKRQAIPRQNLSRERPCPSKAYWTATR